MAQQRWKSGVQRDDVFISADLVFQKIDDARGNGICAGPRGLKRKQDLIIEGALISSVLNKVRFPNLISETSNSNSNNNLSPPRYCSICCCFIGTAQAEFNRLQQFFELHSKVSNHNHKYVLDFDAFDAVASAAGFNAKDHPRWFFNCNEDNNVYGSRRCDICHQTRLLVPQLPQTLEEVGLFIKNALIFDVQSQRNNTLLWKSFSKLISLTKYFDEGLFGITRAILMLVDEVVGGCERVTKEQQKMKSGNWIVSSDKKSTARKDSSPTKIFKQPVSHLFPKNHKSKRWRVHRLLSIVRSKARRLRKSRDRNKYFSRSEVLIATENAVETENCQQLFTLFHYSREIHHRINFFCSCFDPGLRPTHSKDDLVQYQKATNLINEVISGVAKYFYPSLLGQTQKSFRFVTLLQILTLRCCLQNNQHRSLIPNPFNVFIENYQDESTAKQRINNIKKTSSNNKSSSKTMSIPPIKSKNEKQLEENAKICIREIKKLMCHPLMMSEEEDEQAEFLNRDSESSNDDESQANSSDKLVRTNLITRPVVTIEAQALFVNTSRLNHCCDPVACVQPASTIRGAALRVSTLSSVKPGQEIRISYVELEEIEKNKKKVHRYLKKQYGFDCED